MTKYNIMIYGNIFVGITTDKTWGFMLSVVLQYAYYNNVNR